VRVLLAVVLQKDLNHPITGLLKQESNTRDRVNVFVATLCNQPTRSITWRNIQN